MSHFCTMAFGKKYADQARYLVADLQGEGIPILVLTDHPETFRAFSNAVVRSHDPQPFSYHLKRLALAETLGISDSATFIDADCVLRPGVPRSIMRSALNHRFSPGFHCWRTSTIVQAGNYLYPEIEERAHVLGVIYDRDRITCQEMLFNLTSQGGLEKKFLGIWDKLASDPVISSLPARHPLHGGTSEGPCMGIASCASGLTIHGSGEMDESLLSKVFWHCALDYRWRPYHKARQRLHSALGFTRKADLQQSALYRETLVS